MPILSYVLSKSNAFSQSVHLAVSVRHRSVIIAYLCNSRSLAEYIRKTNIHDTEDRVLSRQQSTLNTATHGLAKTTVTNDDANDRVGEVSHKDFGTCLEPVK